jgi:hypothetical protein
MRNVAPHDDQTKQWRHQYFFIMANVDFAKGHGTILSGSVKYARLTEQSGPDGMSEKYGCDLYLDSASTKQLKDLGVLDYVRAKDPQGNFKHEEPVVKVKSINIPKGYLANRQSFDGLIGDGSEIRANVWIKKWEHKGKKGLSVWLSAYVITNLVEYSSGNEDALFEGLDVGELTAEQAAPIPNGKPNVASANEAFDGDDDSSGLPF